MKRLVLAGAGHAHALVLLQWARQPLAGVEVVVVSPQPRAPYSGMVPGWLAGTYRFDEIVVDVPALCTQAGARWLQGEVAALDPARRRLRLLGGEEMEFDVLSLNIGSTLHPPNDAAAKVLAMRPLAALQPAWDAMLHQWTVDPSDRPMVVTTVGGGPAGFETLLATLARLRALRPDRAVHGALITRGAVLEGLAPAARAAGLRALQRAGVMVQVGAGWCGPVGRSSDLVLWATGAEPHDWQIDPGRRGQLAVCERGFVRVDRTLRSVSHPQVFAAGDCAGWAPPLPKAGVHAVRMAPALFHNLRAALGHGRVQTFSPQRTFLMLLATGDGRAIAARGRFGAEGRWAWHWKDHIDRGFIRRFNHLDPAARTPAGPVSGDSP